VTLDVVQDGRGDGPSESVAASGGPGTGDVGHTVASVLRAADGTPPQVNVRQ
jgi:hypothetical protein